MREYLAYHIILLISLMQMQTPAEPARPTSELLQGLAGQRRKVKTGKRAPAGLEIFARG